MAILSNTFETYEQVGRREDLADVIYDISPTETPFISNASKGTANSTYFEWQTDELAAAAANNQLEGNDYTATAQTPTSRQGNYTAISAKSFAVTGTSRAVTTAGRADELGYLLAKNGRELKRDMEKNLVGVSVAGSAGDGEAGTPAARVTAPLASWIITNWSQIATSGSPAAPATSGTGLNGYPDTAAVDGTTPTALDEDDLKTTLQAVWEEGGNPSTVMVGAFNKRQISAFDGLGGSSSIVRMNMSDPGQATIIGAADVYVSDWGQVSIVPNRFQKTDHVYVIDWDYVEVAHLRPMQTEELAKTGDNDKRLLLCEYGLKVKQQKALGSILATTTS